MTPNLRLGIQSFCTCIVPFEKQLVSLLFQLQCVLNCHVLFARVGEMWNAAQSPEFLLGCCGTAGEQAGDIREGDDVR